MFIQSHHLTLLSLLLALLSWSSPVFAERVLLEFAAVDGTPLVAAGDHRDAPDWWDDEETRKRVETRARAIEAARNDLLSSLPPRLAGRVFDDYRNIPLLRMDIDSSERRELEAHPQVTAVHQDRLRRPLMESSLPFIGARYWHEDGHIGEGTAVAVLDSGIRYWNGHFGDCPDPGAPGCRVAVFEGFAHLEWGTGATDPRRVADESSHGTNVGGIVGDVAPGTDLLSLGVFAFYDPNPSSGFQGGVLANDGDVVAALDWVITHREEYNIVSANMSLGGEVDPGMTSYCQGWIAGAYPPAFANVRDAGVLPVVASGNDYVKTSLGPPSCVASAVAVGAGYDDPAFGFECGTGPVVPGSVTCFSNSNALIDLIAPGNDIDAGGIPGLGGTSMAAPHVAGLVALYQERFDTSPIWTLQRMRVDAVPIPEIGPNQLYTHRSIRVGDQEAELAFDSGAVLVSDFSGMPIPDGSEFPLVVEGEVLCESSLCARDVAGQIYLDLSIEHPGTGDLVIELENPAGDIARLEIESDEVLGVENVNSIFGSQHLPNIFDDLRGGPIEGSWTLRITDDTDGRRGSLYRAVLLVDSARTELAATIDAPELARPGESFDVEIAMENRGNLEISDAEITLELVDISTDQVIDEANLDLDLPSAPGDVTTHVLSLEGPQGSYLVRLASTLAPDLPPGLVAEPDELDITYRTLASFSVEPEVPAPGEQAQLTIISRGLVQGQTWDFGDGSSSSSSLPVHAWNEPGEYEVLLEVQGPDGTSYTARTITVAEFVDVPLDIEGGGLDCSCRAPGGRAGTPLGDLLPGILVLLGIFGARRLRRSRVKGRHSARTGLLLLPLLLFGCIDASHPSVPDAGIPETGPWVSLLEPADPSIGDVTVYVMVSADEETTCDIALEYRIGEGGEFLPATLADESTAEEVDALPEGTEVGLPWLSTQDIPQDTGDVQLRALITCDGAESLAAVSSPFTILNFLEVHPDAVLISEVSTADRNVPADVSDDYLELVNTTDETIPLDGWTIIATSAADGLVTFTISDAELGPRERLVLAESESTIEGAYLLEGELPWTVAANGSLAVIATFERGVDFVRWGGSSFSPPTGLYWSDVPPLPIPQTLTVLARADEGVDSDQATDFCVARPTPGDEGAGCIAVYEPSDLMITELDSQSTNDQVEVYNTTREPIDLGGWVVLWDCDDLGSGAIPIPSAELLPHQRIVLRDNGTVGRLYRGILDLGENLNIDGLVPIALALQDPHGEVIDFLAGGGSRVRWMDWTEEEQTPMPGPTTTLSRRPGSPDTDTGEDWCLTERNLLEDASECLVPLGIELVISEVMPGRPDWVEVYNPTEEAVNLRDVYVSYTAPYYGGSVGDYQLRGTLEPGGFVVLSERFIEIVPDAILTGGENMALAPEGDGSVALRDRFGFGIDFVMWGDPAGTPLWPSQWHGLGADTHAEDDFISLQRFPHYAEDTDGRDDWCWAYPSPAGPNATCE